MVALPFGLAKERQHAMNRTMYITDGVERWELDIDSSEERLSPRQTAQAWIDEITEYGDSSFGEMTVIPDSIGDAIRWADIYDRLHDTPELSLVDFLNGERAYWAYLESDVGGSGEATRKLEFHHRVGLYRNYVPHVSTYVDDPEGGERWLVGDISFTGLRGGEMRYIEHEARDQHKLQAHIQDWSDEESAALEASFWSDIKALMWNEDVWAGRYDNGEPDEPECADNADDSRGPQEEDVPDLVLEQLAGKKMPWRRYRAKVGDVLCEHHHRSLHRAFDCLRRELDQEIRERTCFGLLWLDFHGVSAQRLTIDMEVAVVDDQGNLITYESVRHLEGEHPRLF